MKKFNDESVFGTYFKYILALTALAWMTYTLPSVRDAIASAQGYEDSSTAAAIMPFDHMPPMHTGSSSPYMASSTMMDGYRFDMRTASSTMPHPMMNDRRLTPEEVISILVKQGIIPSDKADQARQVIAGYASSTPNGVNIRGYAGFMDRNEASSTYATSTRIHSRPMIPPMPPLPGQPASSTSPSQ